MWRYKVILFSCQFLHLQKSDNYTDISLEISTEYEIVSYFCDLTSLWIAILRHVARDKSWCGLSSVNGVITLLLQFLCEHYCITVHRSKHFLINLEVQLVDQKAWLCRTVWYAQAPSVAASFCSILPRTALRKNVLWWMNWRWHRQYIYVCQDSDLRCNLMSAVLPRAILNVDANELHHTSVKIYTFFNKLEF